MKDSWTKLIEKYNDQSFVSIDKIMLFIDAKRKIFEGNLQIFPPNEKIFCAFDFCEISDIKVVIIGQDPYHGPNQATGLSFAVNNGIQIPPSLRNILIELKTDLELNLVDSSLENWAKQGVLLLNASLTVVQRQPASQMKLWKDFTDYVISELNNQKQSIVFVAWGAFAHTKLVDKINTNKHSMIISSHPSPLSCYKKYGAFPPFKGSKPFSQINIKLQEKNMPQINW
jgi:uracil-DNA glycosylase